jgi:transposase
MFYRKLRKKDGKTYHYILKSVYDKKKRCSVHKQIADLTKLPDEIIETVKSMLAGKKVVLTPKEEKIVKIQSTRILGPLWIAYHFWEELGLHKLNLTKTQYDNLTALVIGRTVSPTVECRSELKTAEYLNKTALSQILGKDNYSWDRNNFYLVLTKLTENWDKIELELWNRRKQVPRLYLYDITSSYFEGKGGTFGALGYSRDEKRGNPQVVIALVSDEKGIPIAIRILPGNTKDSTTVKDTINDLKLKYMAERAIIIMDRGMQSEANVDFIKENGFDFVMALKHKEGREFLKKHNSDLEWTLFDNRNIAQWEENGKRYIICCNPEAAKRDSKTRANIIERGRNRLEKLKNSVVKGRLKNKEKILARAVKILTQTKTEKYFIYEVGESSFSYTQSEVVGWDELYEGCYVLETTLDKTVSKEEIDSNYRNQHEIEEIFKSCKSELNIRPNFHKKDENIFGHIYLTFLSHLVKRSIELKLKENGYYEKGSFALNRFSDITLNQVTINRESELVITELDADHRKITDMLGIKIPTGQLSRTLCGYASKYFHPVGNKVVAKK